MLMRRIVFIMKSSLQRTYRSLFPLAFRVRFKKIRDSLQHRIKYSYVNLIDKNVLNKSKRLEKLHGAYSGQRCFLMGNGPSLNKMNLDLLKYETVWGANRCNLLFDRIQWRPQFYTAVDKRVVPDNAQEINSLVKMLPESHFFFPVDFRLDHILKSTGNVYWYDEVMLNDESLPNSMFSLNPSEFVYAVRTVTIAMLQLAVYLGFNPIYLIGCDTSYIVPHTVIYENENSEFLISTEDDPNHFDSNYFGKGKKWHDPHVDRMLFQYEQAKKVCDALNIQVINSTVGGNLEIFPRINFLELF